MHRILLLIFFLSIALLSCTGSRKHFEWVKVNTVPYLQTQTTTVKDRSLEPKEVQITVYLKEKSKTDYFGSSEEFFKYHNADTADRNFDKKPSFTLKQIKASSKDSDFIYRDEDIEESKLNNGLKQLESTIVKKSKRLNSNNQKELPDKEQHTFNIPKKQLLLYGVATLLILSLLAWMLFRNRTKDSEEN